MFLLGGYVSIWSIVLLLPALALGIFAQIRVNSAFNKYSEIQSARGLTGAKGARTILDRAGLSDVAVEVGAGRLSDHYDPRSRTLVLSPQVANSASLAALGIAAHESGHAIQHASGYVPLRLRSALAPAAATGSNLGFFLFFIGLLFVRSPFLINIGIALFAVAVLFTLVTLPVELDASRRAMAQLSDQAILVASELDAARRVLRAAALTYVAAALMAVLQLVRLIVISRSQ